MMVERKLEEKIFINEIVGKYLRNKHILLEYLARKEENERPQTVIDVKVAFNLKKSYAWTLLKKLELDSLIEKSGKVKMNEIEYNSYILTGKAKQELKIIARFFSRYRI